MFERFRRWIARIGRDQRGIGPLAILLIAALVTGSVLAGMEHEAISDYFGWGSSGDAVMEEGECTPAAYLYWASASCPSTNAVPNVYDEYHLLFTPAVGFVTSSATLKLKALTAQTITFDFEIWSIEDGDWPLCALSMVSSGRATVNLTTSYEWYTVSLTEGFVSGGTQYGVRVFVHDEKDPRWLQYTGSCWSNGSVNLGYYTAGCPEGWGYGEYDYPDKHFALGIWGCYRPEASVTTVAAYFSTYNEVVLQGMLNHIGPNLSNGVYAMFEWGFASGGLSEKYVGTEAVRIGRQAFEMRLSGLPLDATVYFRAGVYGIDSEIETWGSELSFSIPGSEGAMLELEIVENNENRVVFECQVNSLGGATTPDLKLFYGETMAEMLSGNYSVTVSAALAGTGRWSYTDNWSVFEDGKEYYVRSGLVVGGEATAHSDVVRFQRYDSTQPGAVNWLAGLLGISLDWLWWLILIAGLVFVWTFAMTGGRSSPVLGVVGSFVVLGFSIAFGFVNAWVVVLMSILAGWVIFKLIFKHSGGTG